MHNRHAWTERLPEGGKREVRAVKFGGRWSLEENIRNDEGWAGWTRLDPAPVGDLRALREILWRKYQRRRASHDDVLGVERLIREREGDGGG